VDVRLLLVCGPQRREGDQELPRCRAERFEAESLVEGCSALVDCVDDHGAYGDLFDGAADACERVVEQHGAEVVALVL
jgi:hypothetical protein